MHLQRSPLTFERYVEEYEKRWELNIRRRPLPQEDGELTIQTSLDLSYTSLEEVNP